MTKHSDTLIIGGGLSGLTIAHNLQKKDPKHRFLVVEKSNRTGGVIETHDDQGYRTEIGPHGFLDNCQESQNLLAETGLDKEAVRAPLIDFVRYVYLHGKLNLIPQTPRKILMAPLIPWSAKVRVLGDLFKPPLAGEPSVAKWVNHRFGPALLPYLDAVFTGTYAGDYNKLTIDSVMPGVRALEKEHGSVFRALIAKMSASRKNGSNTPKLKMPAMTSFPTGMHRLPERLTENLTPGKNLVLNTEIKSITRTENGWQVDSENEHFSSTNLILALPINHALKLLANLDNPPPEKAIPQAQIASVIFGFNRGETLPPGFGYLIPECENRFTLGSLFSSNMFPGRAPKDHIVFETLVGGRRHPEKLLLDDQTLTEKAFEDVSNILDLPNPPAYTTVLRSDGAIPQLERNYPTLLAWRNTVMASHSGLHICGFGWGGIGINDMIKNGTKIAQTVLSASGPATNEAEVKGIYF